ncbi:hypothetical protein LXA43DRAFT_874407, partial [Ganoderma leucocontextum]
QLSVLLQAYQDLRLPCTADAQRQSRLNQNIFHMPDGQEQEQRNTNMRNAAELELRRWMGGDTRRAGEALEGLSANQWADEKKTRIQFGYNADSVAEQWWRDVG